MTTKKKEKKSQERRNGYERNNITVEYGHESIGVITEQRRGMKGKGIVFLHENKRGTKEDNISSALFHKRKVRKNATKFGDSVNVGLR